MHESTAHACFILPFAPDCVCLSSHITGASPQGVGCHNTLEQRKSSQQTRCFWQGLCSTVKANHMLLKGCACSQVPVFKVLPASVVESLAVVLTEKVLPPRSVVYYQGNEVEELFFIQRGHVKVRSNQSIPQTSDTLSTALQHMCVQPTFNVARLTVCIRQSKCSSCSLPSKQHVWLLQTLQNWVTVS